MSYEKHVFQNHKFRNKLLYGVIVIFIIYILVSGFLFAYYYNQVQEKNKIITKDNDRKNKIIIKYMYDTFKEINYNEKSVERWIEYQLKNNPLSKYKIVEKQYSYPVNPITSFVKKQDREYGYRIIEGYKHLHHGTDIGITTGFASESVCKAIVMITGWHIYWGNYVFIQDYNDADTMFFYAHLENYIVKETQIIDPGDTIGIIGGTGNYGEGFVIHLHFAEYKRLSDGKWYSVNFFQNSIHGRKPEKIKKTDRLLYNYFVENLR